jgi:hypothetical protein
VTERNAKSAIFPVTSGTRMALAALARFPPSRVPVLAVDKVSAAFFRPRQRGCRCRSACATLPVETPAALAISLRVSCLGSGGSLLSFFDKSDFASAVAPCYPKGFGNIAEGYRAPCLCGGTVLPPSAILPKAGDCARHARAVAPCYPCRARRSTMPASAFFLRGCGGDTAAQSRAPAV